jgi:hypothetical protein
MQPGYPSQPPRINNNMTMSIVAILLFWPLAIPAMVNASRVNSLLRRGDHPGAQAAVAESRRWSRLAIIFGVVWLAVLLLSCLLGGLTAGLDGNSPFRSALA